MRTQKPLIILTGPTAVGKTKTSIRLAKELNGEIISADSMQVYRYMDIGTAKIMQKEMDGVTHYLIDEFMPNEDFSVAIFKERAQEAINTIYSKGKIPIIVGGTGFYIQALLYDINFAQVEGHPYRQELEDFVATNGAEALHNKLAFIDETAAAEIHPNNVKRVIRAVEYFYETGDKISEHNATEKAKDSPYNFCYFVLNDKRECLYERIDARIDQMLKQGLVKEVSDLLKQGYGRDLTSMQGLGYKEIVSYLEGEITLDEAVRILKRDTRHFAKRQLTWFKRERDVIWMNKDSYNYDESAIIEQMYKYIDERNIRC